jgi:hypothetical protein
MSRAQLLSLHLSIALTALTGIVFAWMKYLMKSSDPFAVVNHPLQPHMLSAHVILAPAMTFVLGWTFANHIWPRIVLRDPRRRVSGLSSTILIVPMIASGYLLQISTSDAIRNAMAIAHGITSMFFVIGYVIHMLRSLSS